MSMEKLSVSEFLNYCKEMNPSTYKFSSFDQNSTVFGWNISMTSIYDSLIVCLSPRRIIFKDSRGANLILKGVKYVLHQDFGQIGQAFDFVCHDKEDSTVVYRVVANKSM